MESRGWNTYFEATKKRQPSKTAKTALEQFGSQRGTVIDLGCGAGKDVLYFLEHGWNVIAVDHQLDYITQVKEGVDPELRERFQLKKMRFEELKIEEPVDCILANFSLPFCKPEYFHKMWMEITQGVKAGGIFSGVFFGMRDSWQQEMHEKRIFLQKRKLEICSCSFIFLNFKKKNTKANPVAKRDKLFQNTGIFIEWQPEKNNSKNTNLIDS